MSHYKPYPVYKESGVEWLGRVPEHWDIRSVKTLARLDGGAGFPDDEQGQSDNPIPFFKVAELASGLRDTANTVTEETAKRLGAKIFPPSTLVFAKVGAALLLNRRCLLEMPACLDNNMMALLPGTYESQWLFWVFCTLDMGLIANPGAVPSINQEQVGNIRLGVPTIAEQKSIAQSLRRETARIDALIEKKARFIELLREKRQALITHAVTKGLDPNVKMKDSGVEWLGEVPEHWGVKPLKLLVKEGSTISYGIVQPGEPLDEGVPFVQTTNMSSGDFEIESLQKTTPVIAAGFPRSRLTGGEVILGIRASIGAAFVVPMHLAGVNLSRGVARIDCSSELSSHFFVAYLSSMAVDGYWQLAKQGSTFNEVSIATVKELLVPVPPREEQAEIEDMLSNATARLNSILKKTERSIELLKERRSALISAAVTGQIDLREAV
ncbi:restriction endonuclease subunit S [Pseudomonas aeruginosa]|uniref:restriction endonuclease subunit S n=3 Tax=Pseudomonas aeruginosa TaxID=287 RepID=UPI00106728B7|nr:restriction endonuclease subunit S [Pseudomonas aeruginosa]MBG6730914.1 restriction endonuclease subunit S [Pseudomonas aeruginosa]MBX5747711.1 restriction endonuclease subunit S [Pseudomonas aeruginosa]MCT5436919.1 restriction endonuclease subunit S [Pseudomonas aeruginosa]MCT5554623.1 restriction endonuclease subunit S [Pseudomonas aeruginosa]MCT5581608.1 restriction endonuclease subunit S [Pseudomonas aeruginosa]